MYYILPASRVRPVKYFLQQQLPVLNEKNFVSREKVSSHEKKFPAHAAAVLTKMLTAKAKQKIGPLSYSFLNPLHQLMGTQ